MALPLLLPTGALATVGALFRGMLRLEKEQWLPAALGFAHLPFTTRGPIADS
jgi:hypothetical protein